MTKDPRPLKVVGKLFIKDSRGTVRDTVHVTPVSLARLRVSSSFLVQWSIISTVSPEPYTITVHSGLPVSPVGVQPLSLRPSTTGTRASLVGGLSSSSTGLLTKGG